MVYISSWVESRPEVETLDGFAESSINYIRASFEKYSLLTGYDAAEPDSEDLDHSLHISSDYSHKKNNFDAILEVEWDNDDGDEFIDFYKLKFYLNDEYKFEVQEVSVVEDAEFYANYYHGNLVYSSYDDEENIVRSLNLETGEYKVETTISDNN